MSTGSLLLEMAVIRESLEGMLAPEVASKVIFEALEPFGGDLPSGEGLARFVGTELKQSLTSRAGHEVAEDVTSRILKVLGLLIPGKANADADPPWQRQTAEVSLVSGSVRVAVVSATSGMDRRLLAAMGELVMPMGVRRVSRLAVVATDLHPQIVLIDGADPPPDRAADLLGPLRLLSDEALVVVFGSGEPWAQQAVQTVEAMGVGAPKLVELDRREGVDPLLDLIRSRLVREDDQR
ncbi:MAG: hypothetical protein GXP55_08260 [Deltaproteobacteria bacterium]|nr:hypothetical protein [Deltaproteobacteria bacterium]